MLGHDILDQRWSPHCPQVLLETLGPEDRLVVQLLDLEGRTSVEVEQLTGWSSVAVRVRAFRAWRKLRKQFWKLEPRRLHR